MLEKELAGMDRDCQDIKRDRKKRLSFISQIWAII
jgi:hypothetical protein